MKTLKIETEHLVIAPTVEQDIEKLSEYLMDNEVTKYLDLAVELSFQTKEQAMNFLKDKSSDEIIDAVEFTIKLKDSGLPIGKLDLMLFENSILSLGYWLGKDFQGKGYMSEACFEIVNKAFNASDIEMLYIACDFNNEPSIKLADKIFDYIEKSNKNANLLRKKKDFKGGCLQNGKELSFHYFELIFKKLKTEKIIKSNVVDNQIESKESELLYNKLKDIIKEFYKNPMSQMEDKCKKVMSSKNGIPSFLSKRDFEEKSKDNLILYRGMENSSVTNDFFNGKVYLSTNTNNIRGTGIYTTTSQECAKCYASEESNLVKMFISDARILENDRLQKIKSIMKENHPDEFSRFDDVLRDEFINDSAKSYLDNRFNEEVKLWAKKRRIEGSKEEIMAKLDENSLREISKKIKNDPETQKILSKREKFFEDPESFCWYNNGFLTFLLGYDALHSYDYLNDFRDLKEDEYLIVNPKVLNILKSN